jgi:hypothetical protein
MQQHYGCLSSGHNHPCSRGCPTVYTDLMASVCTCSCCLTTSQCGGRFGWSIGSRGWYNPHYSSLVCGYLLYHLKSAHSVRLGTGQITHCSSDNKHGRCCQVTWSSPSDSSLSACSCHTTGHAAPWAERTDLPGPQQCYICEVMPNTDFHFNANRKTGRACGSTRPAHSMRTRSGYLAGDEAWLYEE